MAFMHLGTRLEVCRRKRADYKMPGERIFYLLMNPDYTTYIWLIFYLQTTENGIFYLEDGEYSLDCFFGSKIFTQVFSRGDFLILQKCINTASWYRLFKKRYYISWCKITVHWYHWWWTLFKQQNFSTKIPGSLMSFTTGNVKHWGLKMTPELLLMRGGINNPHFASVTEMKSRLNCCFVA